MSVSKIVVRTSKICVRPRRWRTSTRTYARAPRRGTGSPREDRGRTSRTLSTGEIGPRSARDRREIVMRSRLVRQVPQDTLRLHTRRGRRGACIATYHVLLTCHLLAHRRTHLPPCCAQYKSMLFRGGATTTLSAVTTVALIFWEIVLQYAAQKLTAMESHRTRSAQTPVKTYSMHLTRGGLYAAYRKLESNMNPRAPGRAGRRSRSISSISSPSGSP